MRGFDDLSVLVGRVLIGSLFMAGFVQKLGDPGPATDLLALRGWPGWLLWPAMVYNLLAALAVLLGIGVKPVALSLAAYCAVTSLFHFQPDDPWQISIFVKNWAIAGGCLVLAAHGGGRWRLHLRRRGLS